MSYQQYYGGAIWTNHAIERMQRRGLPQQTAWEAFAHPSASSKGKQPGTSQYQRKIDRTLVTIIAKQNEKNEWIILSAWVDPPLPGSPDAKAKSSYKNYQKASAFRKFLLTVKEQLKF